MLTADLTRSSSAAPHASLEKVVPPGRSSLARASGQEFAFLQDGAHPRPPASGPELACAHLPPRRSYPMRSLPGRTSPSRAHIRTRVPPARSPPGRWRWERGGGAHRGAATKLTGDGEDRWGAAKSLEMGKRRQGTTAVEGCRRSGWVGAVGERRRGGKGTWPVDWRGGARRGADGGCEGVANADEYGGQAVQIEEGCG
jgi:hypothetical protein